MKLIRGVHNINNIHYGCVLTIGNFDGVHRGHKVLLQELKKEGIARRLPVIVIIFEPQPLEVFAGKNAPARLTCLREKLYYLTQCGIDYVLCINFNKRFAALTARNFVSDLLMKRLGVQLIVVGDDFRFGADRKGNFSFLRKIGLSYGFDVINTRSLCENGIRISSTAVRQALLEDNLEVAENLLGHPFIVSGRVIHGNELGRTIGFPTANLSLHRQISPVKGVYAVEVIGLGDKPIPGIANIGTRPTVVKSANQQMEVHLLGMLINIYGYYIKVILRKKIRNEQKFASIKDLKMQIIRDELMAREFFNLPN